MKTTIIRIEKLLVAIFCFWLVSKCGLTIDEPSTFEIVLGFLKLLISFFLWCIGTIAILMYVSDLYELKKESKKEEQL